MRLKKVIKLFERGNVCVCGLRGSGKDLLLSNVIARRASPYVSNVPYGGEHFSLDFEKIDCGKNSFADFIEGKCKGYIYPYPQGTDIYVSDAGIYLPSQYCGELNKKYPYLATFQALSRHVGRCNFHFNAQALNRVYDKVREQSDVYIMCNWCVVLFGGRIVLQCVTLYDKYQSAVDRVRSCRIHVPLFAGVQVRQQAQMYRDNFYNQHGEVKRRFLLYRHRGTYDSHYFGTLLGDIYEQEHTN